MRSDIFCFILKSIILSSLSWELFGAFHHFSFHNKSHEGEELKVCQGIRSCGHHKRKFFFGTIKWKIAYLCTSAYPHVLPFPVRVLQKENSVAGNLDVSEDLGFSY